MQRSVSEGTTYNIMLTMVITFCQFASIFSFTFSIQASKNQYWIFITRPIFLTTKRAIQRRKEAKQRDNKEGMQKRGKKYRKNAKER